jgi:uncharacterized PurR-regulated membrane protein YhhQ (DUF165 family)
MIGYIAFALFALTIPLANWLIGNVGTMCIPNGPCMVPVDFGLLGLMAPSGVLVVGAALVLRDIVHERLGWAWAVGAIAVGAALSWWLASPALAIASVVAFALAETADLVVYSPLRKRNLPLAVFASGVVGSAIDSAVFLWLAFGSLNFIEGQIIGKMWMTLAAVGVLVAIRSSRKVSFEPRDRQPWVREASRRKASGKRKAA